MPKRFYIEPRASESYPWQLVDVKAELGAGPISIHKTKRQAKKARDDYRAMLRRDARMERQLRKQRLTEPTNAH